MNVSKLAVLVTTCGAILNGCSGESISAESNDLDAQGSLSIAQAAYQEYLQLNSNRPIQKARPACPSVSEVNFGVLIPQSDAFEHLFLAECEESGVVYTAIMIDRTKNGSQLDSRDLDEEFNIIAATSGKNGERATAHVQNLDSGGCPPVRGGNPATEVTQNYGSCRPVSGIEVSVFR